ncbi:20S proteasome subunit beta 4 [Nematocida minor]|uniref:20S proteasome subunit beta 4 n=1 Tax=Nematocida minor TaxID=1912983 RepID=UPI00222034CA|nr:20S proteasome subunit beta 4 [Nematocida minor]KAI5191316.1 20S proteasome subunit beta 4 [Nematocida minor]
MDVLFGVAGRDYVVLACDTMFRNNVLVPKNDHNKCTEITKYSAVISGGKQGDCDRVIRAVLEQLKYENISNGLELTEKVFSSALQEEIHGRLRRSPVELSSIVGGVSEGTGKLFMVDQYGACSSYKHMATGYGAPFFITGMKMKHTDEMGVKETVDLIQEIYEGVKRRLVLNYGKLHFCAITKDGVQRFDDTS